MNNPDYHIEIQEASKVFSGRLIFKNLSFNFGGPGIYGIAGSNGIGKSTLVKMLAHLISPTRGKIAHIKSGLQIPEERICDHIGFLSPYLVFYEEFSALENINYFQKIRNHPKDEHLVDELFAKLELAGRRNDPVKVYSSGMKQRLKLIFALAHKPEVIILDEPTSNLDEKGKDQFYNTIKSLQNDRIVIIASNEHSDLALCGRVLNLEDYR